MVGTLADRGMGGWRSDESACLSGQVLAGDTECCNTVTCKDNCSVGSGPRSSRLGSSEPLVYTIPEAANALRLSRTKFYELLDSGEVESIHIGRSRKIPADALRAYIDGLRARGTRPTTESSDHERRES
jgi:excisionase family DNA binding protein